MFYLGQLIFFGTLFFTTYARGAREGLVAKLGANGYKGLYSIGALAGFVLIVMGWKSASTAALYAPPAFLRHVTFLLMAPALILLVSAYLPAGKIKAAVKHPMLAGVKIWAFAHLLSNGEIRSVILFGAFLLYAVLDRIAVKKRGDATPTAGAVTNDILAIVIGLAAYAAILFYLHPHIAGVPIVY